MLNFEYGIISRSKSQSHNQFWLLCVHSYRCRPRSVVSGIVTSALSDRYMAL